MRPACAALLLGGGGRVQGPARRLPSRGGLLRRPAARALLPAAAVRQLRPPAPAAARPQPRRRAAAALPRRGIRTGAAGVEGAPEVAGVVVLPLEAPAAATGGAADPYHTPNDGLRGSFLYAGGRLPALGRWLNGGARPPTVTPTYRLRPSFGPTSSLY